jgi:FMN phosphatase YigB (HAD superfamily)
MTLFTVDIIGTMGTAIGNPAQLLADVAQHHNPAPIRDSNDPHPHTTTDQTPNPWTLRAAEIDRWLLNTTPQLDQPIREAVAAYLMFPVTAWPAELHPHFHAYDYTAQALAELHTRGEVAALSNLSVFGGPALVEAISDHLGRLIPRIYTSYTLRTRKPHPHCWHHIASDHNTTVDKIIHIGDLIPEDILGALNAGCRAAILVGPQGQHAPQWIHDDPRVTIVPDLLAAAACLPTCGA